MSTTFLPPATPIPLIPPLQEGEQLSRDEFERRYHAMPENVKAELIEGVVYMASPSHFKLHGSSDFRLTTWLGTYQAATPGTDGSANGTVRLGKNDEPQPDCILIIVPECGGTVRISADDYLENAPDLIVEISASSASRDLGPKKRSYAQHGVREYLVWRTQDKAIDWFVLKNGSYVSLVAGADGILRSEIFPGLWLNVPAVLSRDSAAMLATLQQGLASPDHARFVAELQARRTS